MQRHPGFLGGVEPGDLNMLADGPEKLERERHGALPVSCLKLVETIAKIA